MQSTCFLWVLGLVASFLGSDLAWSGVKPKLGVVLVIDQFRADYLMRLEKEFLNPSEMGFRGLMKEGAYYPYVDHQTLQSMTCPGHANLLTGTTPSSHGISLNHFYDRKTKKNVYCVQDEESVLLGSDLKERSGLGVSPKSLRADTVGDQLRALYPKSRVYSFSLKDRAAILMGGKNPNLAAWMDKNTCEWISSRYYEKEIQKLKPYQEKTKSLANQKHFNVDGKTEVAGCSKEGAALIWAEEALLNLGLDFIEGEKLGKAGETDLIYLSLSNHDIQGHRHGAESAILREFTIQEDRLISKFMKSLVKKFKKDEIFVVLSGDHGLPISSERMGKMPSGGISDDRVEKDLENLMVETLGKPKGGRWIEKHIEMNVYLNASSLMSSEMQLADVARKIRSKLDQVPYLEDVYATAPAREGLGPSTGIIGRFLATTMSSMNGDLVFILKPYYYTGHDAFSHQTHYSYDRLVPVILWGGAFKPVPKAGIEKLTDLAPTLSRVLGVLPPSKNEGKIWVEALR